MDGDILTPKPSCLSSLVITRAHTHPSDGHVPVSEGLGAIRAFASVIRSVVRSPLLTRLPVCALHLPLFLATLAPFALASSSRHGPMARTFSQEPASGVHRTRLAL